MIVACWSVKGGSGTTVVAASLALVLARSSSDGVVLVDLGGDLPAVLGMPEPSGPGIVDWLAAGATVPPDGLARLEVPVVPGLRLVPRGEGPVTGVTERLEVLASVLASDHRPVVVDAGLVPVNGDGGAAGELARVFAASATQSLLVTRGCYLAVRRAARASVLPSGVVFVREKDRCLTAADIRAALGVPIIAVVRQEAAIARAVDAGLLTVRLPDGLAKSLRLAS